MTHAAPMKDKVMERGIAVVIVCHNAQRDLEQCLDSLAAGSLQPTFTCIVDSGSTHTAYLDALAKRPATQIIRKGNIGYGQGNNIGFAACPLDIAYVLFLNPDCFVWPDTLAQALQVLDENATVACVGARLGGYERGRKQASGLLDSTGVVRSWYGRWYDRGQGETDTVQYQEPEEMPALCGAFLCCRRQALEQVALAPGVIFDPAFFLYKEDIELGLRLRGAGWRLLYHPQVRAWHCRGWNSSRQRQSVPYRLRVMAAANEVRLYCRHPSVYMLWALAKYLLVRYGRF